MCLLGLPKLVNTLGSAVISSIPPDGQDSPASTFPVAGSDSFGAEMLKLVASSRSNVSAPGLQT